MILERNIFAAAMLVFGLLVAKSEAQDSWRGFPSYCGQHEGCPWGEDNSGCNSSDQALKWNRYGGEIYQSGQNFGRENMACAEGRCPYEQNQFHNHFGAPSRSTYDSGPNNNFGYGGPYAPSPNYHSRPAQRGPYQTTPADQRPQLNAPPVASPMTAPMSPRSNFAPENVTSDSTDFQLVPPTSRQAAPPFIPPTNMSAIQRQQPRDDHAGHDHAGHSH